MYTIINQQNIKNVVASTYLFHHVAVAHDDVTALGVAAAVVAAYARY